MPVWRRLLFPFSILFGIVVRIRNFLFDIGILKQHQFTMPVIGVGNLTAGGTGKTPHIEYLIRLLQGHYKLATVSRGYGRSSKGVIIATEPCDASRIGDEPMQYYNKFNDITVVVGERRSKAIKLLLQKGKMLDAILLDDNYQHRSVKAGLQILLISFDSLGEFNMLLPAGNLREPFSSISRADIIIISKTPSILVPIERKRLLELIPSKRDQPVFFTYYKYGELHRLYGKNSDMMMGADYYRANRFTVLLICGIADPGGLIEYMKRNTNKLETIIYPDHHTFEKKDIDHIKSVFEAITNPNKIIVTTEKDAMRFRQPDIEALTRQLPVFYIPIEVAFHQDATTFDNSIVEYVKENKRSN